MSEGDDAFVSRWTEIESFVEGLYEELDKLCKKAPAGSLSDLATDRVNRAVRDTVGFLGEYDGYVRDLREFVPAGSNPEVRDAVLVLREIRQALSRHEPI